MASPQLPALIQDRRLTPGRLDDLRLRLRLERAWRSLYDFLQLFWTVVEPGRDFDPNWHVRAICDELERVTRGEIKRLVICIPPGMMKTLMVNVMCLAWQMLHRPQLRTLCVSHTVGLANEASRKTRAIVKSALYQRLLEYGIETGRAGWSAHTDGRPWELRQDQAAVSNWGNNLHGARQCIGILAAITGKRGDQLVVDDPYDAKEVVRHSLQVQARMMKAVVDTFDNVLDSRLNDPETSAQVVIMQMLHPEDLANVLLDRPEWTDNAEGGQAVILPMEYDPAHPHAYERDQRTEPGELLHPDRYSAKWVAQRRDRMGRHYLAQYGQRPRPGEGKRFKRSWFKRYSAHPAAIAKACGQVAITIDCASSSEESADSTSMQVWARMREKRFLVDRISGQWRSPRQRLELRGLWERWSPFGCPLVLIEEASNGHALLDFARAAGMPAVGFKPTKLGGKPARAAYTEGAGQAGQLYIPEDDHPDAPWLAAWLDQHLDFPTGHDDDVDATSQLMAHWSHGVTASPLDALGWMEDL